MRRIGMARVVALVGLTTVIACGLSVVGVDSLVVEANDAAAPSDGSSALADGGGGSGSSSSGGSSGSPPADAGTDADSGGPIFGEDCPTGTSYVDDFSSDPKGRWIDAHATWTWSATQKTFTVTGFDPHGVVWIGPRPKWVNYSVEMEMKVSNTSVGGANGGPLVRIMSFGTPPLQNNEGQMFLAAVIINSSDDVIFGTEDNGWTQNDQVNDGNIPLDTWIRFRTEARGSTFKLYTNDTLRLTVTNNKYGSGSIGIKTWQLPLSIRRVEVKCL